MFEVIEQGKGGLGISDYSFNQATLEGVFISFAKKQIDADK